MKNILSCTILFFGIIGTQAQTQVLNKKNPGSYQFRNPNLYFKDIDNDMDEFIGEYLYTNGNISLRIKLNKEYMVPTFSSYSDIISGEVKYTVGNLTKINTLNNILNTENHAITMDLMVEKTSTRGRGYCPECAAGDVILYGTLKEPNSSSELRMYKITVNGVPAIKLVNQRGYESPRIVGQNYTEPIFIIPHGEYVLIKQ